MTTSRRYKKGQTLSGREMQVLRSAAGGESVAGSAAILGLAVETVKAHRVHILQKLGASNTTHAVAIAFRKGWLQ